MSAATIDMATPEQLSLRVDAPALLRWKSSLSKFRQAGRKNINLAP
jgi:hypothetical protein